jgi:CRP-like cAMP-binding protein
LEVLFTLAPRRVQHRLLVLSGEFGDEPIAVTQEELALMAGTTRTTVNEILRDLEQRGTIRLGRGRLEVLDRPALARQLKW